MIPVARDYAAIYTSIWSDPDWRNLTAAQQHTYLQVLTQPKLSPCGVLDYLPNRLARGSSGLTETVVAANIKILRQADPRPWLVLDEETDELLARSFVRYDSLMNAHRSAKAVAKDYRTITSAALRLTVVEELRKLYDEKPSMAGWKGIREQDSDLWFDVTGEAA